MNETAYSRLRQLVQDGPLVSPDGQLVRLHFTDQQRILDLAEDIVAEKNERLRRMLKAVAAANHSAATHWRRSGRVRFEECAMKICVQARAMLEKA